MTHELPAILGHYDLTTVVVIISTHGIPFFKDTIDLRGYDAKLTTLSSINTFQINDAKLTTLSSNFNTFQITL
jgi:hypothetical protein